MKFRIPLFSIAATFLTLWLSAPLCAQSSPQMIQFMKNMNLRYYCLSREGLTHFKCLIHLSIPPAQIQSFSDKLRRSNVLKVRDCVNVLEQTPYVLKFRDDKITVMTGLIPDTGDAKADKMIEDQCTQYAQMMAQMIQNWDSMQGNGFFGGDDFTVKNFTYQKTAGGFLLFGKAKDEADTIQFDAQGAQLGYQAVLKGVSNVATMDYYRLPEGFMVKGIHFTGDGVEAFSTYSYGKLGKCILPTKLNFNWLVPGVMSLDDHFEATFTNYQLNPLEDDNKVIVTVSGHEADPTYHYDSSTTQIEKFNKKWIPSRNKHEPGLTSFRYDWRVWFNIEFKQDDNQNTVQFWITDLDLHFALAKLDVYVSNEYPKDSCAFGVILKHENQHVSICRTTFEKYKKLMQEALEADTRLPTKAKPWTVASEKKGQGLLTQHLEDTLGPLIRTFWKDEGIQNGTIDLPSSYRKTQAECKDW